MKRLSGSLNTEQREWLLLISACLIKLISGQVVSGAVYAHYMKSSYGLNQRQLNLCFAIMYLGTLLIVVSGFFYDRYGARAAVLVSGVFSTASTAALALAMAHPEPLRRHLWLLYMLLFLYGHSFNYSYMAAIACCMASFQASRRGYIMSMLDNSFNLGAPMVALVFYVVFDNTHRSPEAQSPVGTLAVMTLLTACVHLFAFFFLTPLDGPLSLDLGEETPILRAKSGAEFSSSSSDDDQQQATPEDDDGERRSPPPEGFAAQVREFVVSCCCSARFLPLLLAFALVQAPTLVVFLNVTSVTRSLGLSRHDVLFFWFPNLAGIAWRCLIGPLTDRYFPLAYQRSATLLVCLACFGTPAALMLCTPIAPGASPLGVTMAANILEAVSVATLFTLIPVIISQTEARHLFGRLYSACMVTGALLSLPLMLQFGAIYDSHSVAVTPPTAGGGGNHGNGGNATGPAVEFECTGQSCYVYGGVANTVSHLVGLACLTYYTASLKLTSS